MANQDQINQLKQIAQALQKIDREKLLRSSLGEESLESELRPKLEAVQKKLDFAIEFAPSLHPNQVQPVIQAFQNINRVLDEQAKWSNAEYISQRTTFLNNLEGYLDEIQYYWPPFVTAAVEERGFLEDEGIRREYQRMVDAMKEESASALKLVKEESAKTIQEAQNLAQQIEERARRTAAHISVKDAQDQFQQAQKYHSKQVSLWAVLSAIPVILFFIFICHFYNEPILNDKPVIDEKMQENFKWLVLYKSVIRITILTAIGAVATFSLRVLRAHMHLREHNLHRQRVTNSMAAFVESAVTPEQRDLILTHLVDAVAMFGTSGLLQKEDDSIYSPKMTIDTITRTFTTPPAKHG